MNARWLVVFGIYFLAGCSAFDFEIKQTIEEVQVQGDANLYAQRYPLPNDIIPPQSWSYNLPEEPAGIFLESMSLQMTATAGLINGQLPTFDFMYGITFYVQSTLDGSSLEQQPLAWGTPRWGEVEVVMEPNFALNLVPFMQEGFEITSILKAAVPPSNLSFKGAALLSVDIF
jgi:hypothetical protein